MEPNTASAGSTIDLELGRNNDFGRLETMENMKSYHEIGQICDEQTAWCLGGQIWRLLVDGTLKGHTQEQSDYGERDVHRSSQFGVGFH